MRGLRDVIHEPPIFSVPTPKPLPTIPPQKCLITDESLVVKKYLSGLEPPIPLNDNKRTETRNYIKMIKVRIAQLQAVYDEGDLEYLRHTINNQIHLLLMKIRVIGFVLFPICQLPLELLAQIFNYVIHPDPLPGIKYHRHARNALMGTCRHFRECMLLYRTLWRTVMFTDRSPWRASFRDIERAKDVPLYIGIGQSPTLVGAPYISPTLARKLILRLESVQPKLRQVVVGLPDGAMLRFCKYLSAHESLPDLQRITLHLVHEKDRAGNIVPRTGPPSLTIALGTNAPRLCTVELDSIKINWEKQPPSLFSTVKDLILGSSFAEMPRPSSHRWTQILTEASSTLIRMELRSLWPHCDWTGPRPVRVMLSHLMDVRMTYDVASRSAEFTLAHFRAPNLVCLVLETTRVEPVDLQLLCDMTHGEFPQLRILTLRFVSAGRFMGNQIGRWLRAMPRLKVLKIGRTYPALATVLHPLCTPDLYLTEQEFEAISIAHANGTGSVVPVCCPDIEEVHVCWEWATEPVREMQMVAGFLGARRALNKPFTRFYITNKNKFAELMALVNRFGIHMLVGSLWPHSVEVLMPTESKVLLDTWNACGYHR